MMPARTRRELARVAVLLFVAAGILAALGLAGHHHGPDQACRICPTMHSVDTVDVVRVAIAPELRDAPLPPPVEQDPSSVDLLVTSPLRGPPA